MSIQTKIDFVKKTVDRWVDMLGYSIEEILAHETTNTESGFYKAQQVIFNYYRLIGASTPLNVYQIKEQITDRVLCNVFAKDHIQALNFACSKIQNKQAKITLNYLQNNTKEVPF